MVLHEGVCAPREQDDNRLWCPCYRLPCDSHGCTCRYELEKIKDTHAKQEAVLRRKLEEATAIQQRNQETIRKLTAGQRATAESTIGFRQKARHKELRQYVQRELEACSVLHKARVVLRTHLERRSDVAHQLNGERPLMDGEEREALEREVSELSGSIERLQREVMDLETRVGLDEEGGEDTKRWFAVKTLGEARQVLAILFDKALKAQADRRRSSTSLGGGLPPASTAATEPLPSPSSKVTSASPAPQSAQSPPLKAAESSNAPKAKGAPVPKQVVVVVVEEEDESEYEMSSSDESFDDSDSDYDPEDSPSRVRRGKGNGQQRGSKEGCVLHVNKNRLAPPKKRQSVAPPRKKRRSGSGASLPWNSQETKSLPGSADRKGGKAMASVPNLQQQYHDIDALLSDNDRASPAAMPSPCTIDVTLPIDALEPLGKWTVPELKQVLRAHHLPLGGKKGG